MLMLLHIENIAVIEKADITFQNGFNALTGETGAGKSIVIDALGAVLGQRSMLLSVQFFPMWIRAFPFLLSRESNRMRKDLYCCSAISRQMENPFAESMDDHALFHS